MIPADHNRFTVDNAKTILREFGGQINVLLPLDDAHIALANQKFEETAGLVNCDRDTTDRGSGRGRGRGKSRRLRNYRQKTRVQSRRKVKKTKRNRKSGKRQTKRRQKK
jgi:hypothetical protein